MEQSIEREIFDYAACLVSKYKATTTQSVLLLRQILDKHMDLKSVSRDDPMFEAHYIEREKILNSLVDAFQEIKK